MIDYLNYWLPTNLNHWLGIVLVYSEILVPATAKILLYA